MIVTDEMIISWLRERQANATRIAHMKSGADRVGWYEDAAYFKHAADAIRYYKDAYSRKIDEVAELGKRILCS